MVSTAKPANDERPSRAREPARVFSVTVNVVDLQQSLERGFNDPGTQCGGVVKKDLWQFASMYSSCMLEMSWDLSACTTRLVKQHGPIRSLEPEGCHVSPYHQPVAGGVSACEFTNFLAPLPAIRLYTGWLNVRTLYGCTLRISPTQGPSYLSCFGNVNIDQSQVLVATHLESPTQTALYLSACKCHDKNFFYQETSVNYLLIN